VDRAKKLQSRIDSRRVASDATNARNERSSLLFEKKKRRREDEKNESSARNWEIRNYPALLRNALLRKK